eukprot:MONOS_16439.1-p1 / transcript=MONOS_16439.1 / gene=MONOS_16439 / organism=Monocercomonoides_exilis_PA203 / gene_product=alanyl-tRNA synthetase, incomplete, only N-terminal part / transcript_product=alanyl-tRNA synthetase, incomplete, only N-terminal part / location=Mono_scaffold01740:4299-4682(+) / protein_length=89 / sequence_SO=supercontig / SO=protein_coding / is_pseudo=false
MAAEEEAHPCSSKELKAYARPIFAREWEKYYPTVVLKDYGFERVTCKCGHNYWRASPERTMRRQQLRREVRAHRGGVRDRGAGPQDHV